MIELIDLVNDHGEVIPEFREVPRGDFEASPEKYPGARMQIVIAVILNSLGEVLVHERAESKSHGGQIDLVCGGIQSGQTPVKAARAESAQEVGPVPDDFQVIRRGVNEYGRYCFLLLGHSDEPPKKDLDPDEVAWAAYMSVDELKAKAETGELTFVDGFFEDLEYAMTQNAMIETLDT